jgi:hypothetical protein
MGQDRVIVIGDADRRCGERFLEAVGIPVSRWKEAAHAMGDIGHGAVAVVVMGDWLRSVEDWGALGALTSISRRLDIPVIAYIDRFAPDILVARILDHGFDEVLSEGMGIHEQLGRFRRLRRDMRERIDLRDRMGIDPDTGLWTAAVAREAMVGTAAFSKRNREPLSVSLVRVREECSGAIGSTGKCMKLVCHRARSLLRTEDQVYRVGDCMLLILWSVCGEREAQVVMSRVAAVLAGALSDIGLVGEIDCLTQAVNLEEEVWPQIERWIGEFGPVDRSRASGGCF